MAKRKLPRRKRMAPTAVSAYAKDDLCPKKQLFVNALLASESFNATEAARIAGYKAPSVAASKLMHDEIIARIIGKRLHDRLERLELTADEVISQLTCILRFDPLELFDVKPDGILTVKNLSQVPIAMRRCITKLKPKTKVTRDRSGNETIEHSIDIEFMDKNAALALAMRHFGLIVDNKSMKIGLEADTAGLLGSLLTDLEKRGSNIVDAHVIEQKLLGSNGSSNRKVIDVD